jgi:hypothetical protein
MLFTPESSIKFANSIHAFALQAAALGFVVGSLRVDYCFFGSWKIEVWNARNDTAIQASFDDRDRVLEISASPIRPLSHPNEWELGIEETFPRGEIADSPQQFFMRYLTTRKG